MFDGVSATLKNIGVSPQKARLVADQVRGKKVAQALLTLQFSDKKSGLIIRKVLESAIANAEHNNGHDIDDLYVSAICVDEAPVLRRFQARAKGRGNRIIKRRSHVRVVVSPVLAGKRG